MTKAAASKDRVNLGLNMELENYKVKSQLALLTLQETPSVHDSLNMIP